MIVQELHAIQHQHGYLPRAELKALADRIATPLYRLQEVASFFPHFRTQPPAAVEVRVCRDMSCHLRGSPRLLRALETLRSRHGDKVLSIAGVSCLGRCDRAPAACVNEHVYANRTEAELIEIVSAAVAGSPPPHDQDAAQAPSMPLPWKIDPYQGRPTYEAVRRFAAKPDPLRLVEELKTSDLRGMGGAGAPAHKKWNDAREAEGDEKYIVCNADESEPGTFKDRELLLRTPYLVVEGVILAGLVVGATRGYIYVRHEYHEAIEAVRAAIREAEKIGACGRDVFGTGRAYPVEVFVSPGGYICGEQSALLEAMEDRRAEPRNRPPELATNGLRDRPTVVNNVETLAWAPAIALNGGAWYRDQGVNGFKGLRFFSISGDVARPGVYEVPIGLTLRDLLQRHAGGMRGGRALKAIAPSGPSGGFLPPLIPVETLPERFVKEKLPAGTKFLDLLDLQLDLQLFRDLGLMLGAGLVVYAEGTDLVEQAVNCLEFFRNESCGKCVPCRIGSQKLVEIGTELLQARYDRARWSATEPVVRELARAMELTAICGLGQVAANPLAKLARYFPDDVQKCLGEHGA